MAALYWQVAIITSILLSTYVQQKMASHAVYSASTVVRNLSKIVPLAWVLWTFLAVSGPLLVFQLAVVLVTSILCSHILKKFKNYDNQLQAALNDANDLQNPNFDEAIIREQAAKAAQADAISKLSPIDGLENLKSELDFALKNAEQRLLIMSGWASSYVINTQFIDNCLKLMSRGVEIHIGFGYDTTSDKKMPDWEKKGRSQVNQLMKQAIDQDLENNLFIYEFDNHYKSLVKDSDYFITGSINWLSNSRGKNYERAWKNEFPQLADKEFDDCVAMMRPKKVIMRRKFLKPFLDWQEKD